MITLNPILYVLISSSFACASNFASSDDLISQNESENSSISVIGQNSSLQETKNYDDPAVTEIRPVDLQFLSEEEIKILNLLNECLAISDSNQRVALKKFNNDLKKAFKNSQKAKSTLKKTKKSIKRAEKIFKEAAIENSSMDEMLANFYTLKIQAIGKTEIDFKKAEETEELIPEAREQFLKQFGMISMDSEKSNENI